MEVGLWGRGHRSQGLGSCGHLGGQTVNAHAWCPLKRIPRVGAGPGV